MTDEEARSVSRERGCPISGPKHTPTREPPLTRDLIHPSPYFFPFYPDGIPDHAELLFRVVEHAGHRMGGDEYRCMGNLISRTFVDQQQLHEVAVAKLYIPNP
jgi:hypothetical protein